MIIEVRPCRKFKGAWVAFEAPGVEPAFPALTESRTRLITPGAALAGVAARFTFTATTLQPSSAASSSTVAASIHKSPAIKKTRYTHREIETLRSAIGKLPDGAALACPSPLARMRGTLPAAKIRALRRRVQRSRALRC